jgi:hypothetical protein
MRLRDPIDATDNEDGLCRLCYEAADEIERLQRERGDPRYPVLRAERDRLRVALERIATEQPPLVPLSNMHRVDMQRIAREALAHEPVTRRERL